MRELKGTSRRDLKNIKFPLLKAKHNRSAKDKQVLREQVRANRRLYRAMLLRDRSFGLHSAEALISLVYLSGGLTLERIH